MKYTPQAENGEGAMRQACTLVLVVSLCLICETVRADTIACESPDLGLDTTGAKEQVDAMCAREKAWAGSGDTDSDYQERSDERQRLSQSRQRAGHARRVVLCFE